MDHTPASLLDRLRRPDEAAWNHFVELYTPLLFHYARRAGVRSDDAGDLVQDVLALLVRKLPEFQYDPRASFRAWLRTVLVNRVREIHRRAEQRNPAGPLVGDVAASDDGPELEEVEYRRYLVQRTLTLLRGEFPETTWKAFQEHVVQGRDAAEVAAGLGLKIGTVYAAKSRVLTRLRQELNGLLE